MYDIIRLMYMYNDISRIVHYIIYNKLINKVANTKIIDIVIYDIYDII